MYYIYISSLPVAVAEDSQELLINMERLKARCEAVQIQVHTVRDDGQLQSLDKVNNVLQELQTRLASNDNVPRMAVKQARSYLNACLPEAVGSIDTRFQSLVLGCAVDDQKDVRRRLQSLVRESNVDLESGSSKSRNTNENYTATTERSDNLTENSVYTGTATVNHKPPSSGEQTGDVLRETSGPSENHHTAQWYTATSTKPGSFDDSDLSVSQQEGESIQQVHLKEGNASPRSHSRQPHFDGPISS